MARRADAGLRAIGRGTSVVIRFVTRDAERNWSTASDHFIDRRSAIGQLSDKIGETHPHCLKTRLAFARVLLNDDTDECEKQLELLWEQLPSDAERQLLPSELRRRNETAEMFAQLHEKLGNPAAQKKWQSRMRDH